jgi:hypothetical protein
MPLGGLIGSKDDPLRSNAYNCTIGARGRKVKRRPTATADRGSPTPAVDTSLLAPQST